MRSQSDRFSVVQLYPLSGAVNFGKNPALEYNKQTVGNS